MLHSGKGGLVIVKEQLEVVLTSTTTLPSPKMLWGNRAGTNKPEEDYIDYMSGHTPAAMKAGEDGTKPKLWDPVQEALR